MSTGVPRVSIVMAVYNGVAYIDVALGSLQRQTLPDLEIIVVDDGSTDDTVAAVRRRAADDARIRLITRPNAGRPSIPRNDGLDLTRGKFIGFLDHDDFSHPERLAVMVAALEENPRWVAAFHDLDLVNAAGTSLGRTLLQTSGFRQRAAELLLPRVAPLFELAPGFASFASLYTAGMHTQSVLLARERLDFDALRFDPRFSICDDTDMWMRVAVSGTVGFVDSVLGSYRQHEGSLMTRRRAFLEDTISLHVHNYARMTSRFDAATLARYRERIGGHYATLGWHHLNALEPGLARAPLREAVRWCPTAEHRRMLFRSYLPKTGQRLLRMLRRGS
ncbi:MAG: glycosyltransferase family 2 protein [Burkholderiales bacterium]